MNLKLKPISQVSLALAAVFVAGVASATDANTFTVYLSGASAPTQTVFRAFASNCTNTGGDPTKPNVRINTSGSATAKLPGSLGNEMAYVCIFKNDITTFPVAYRGKTVVMHHNIKGGSFNAFAPHLPSSHTSYPGGATNPDVPQPLIYDATTHAFTNCVNVLDPVDATVEADLWNGCQIQPAGVFFVAPTFMNPYNGGFSDVEANMWSSTLVTDVNDLQNLASASAGVQQAFGIAVTDELYKAMQAAEGLVVGVPLNPAALTAIDEDNQPNITKADYAGIVALAGGYHTDWKFMLDTTFTPGAGAGKNVNLCRRVPTSGTQASSNFHILGTPCSLNPINQGALDPAGVGDSTATFNVVENSSSTNVKTCLTNRNNTAGQAFGIGYLSLENIPAASDKWKFVKVHDVSPNEDPKQRRNAARGNYDLVSEMVYFVKPGSSATIQSFFKDALVGKMAPSLDLAGLFATPEIAGSGTGPVPDGDKVGRSTRGGNSCTSLHRQ